MLLILLFCAAAVQANPDRPLYLKYFKTEQDIVVGKSVSPDQRPDYDYFVLMYNEADLPVEKYRIASPGDTVLRETFTYQDKALWKRLVRDKSKSGMTLFIYSDKEPWSIHFRRYQFPAENDLAFGGQVTRFSIAADGSVTAVNFYSIDNHRYGRIAFSYDYLGLVREETWTAFPGSAIVRRYVYEFNLETHGKKLWEYGSDGREVSYIELAMAPADELYPYPVPRTGNILEEKEDIIREIKTSGIVPPLPAYIPRLEWDQILFLSGEIRDVILVDLESESVTIRFPGESDRLTIPLKRIRQIKSHWGDLIYPEFR